ncbi:tRNA pseudouridine(38-40) synthase TruA [Pseudogracilibacillus auburnensis]|nr:tRNA pseudouridine(38-40) synthase TruA [Pseudogracilibacillus auburnensis]
MQRYKATLAYDGSRFSGFQIQPNARTVQKELENALGKMHKGKAVKVTGSGRTDARVHAKGQVVHFDSTLLLPPERWMKALNTLLPVDVSIVRVEAVQADYHARFDATGKTYKYVVYRAAIRDPFRHHYTAHFPYPLQINLMREAATELVGTHDFTSFCSAKTDVNEKVRTVSELMIEELADELVFTFTGNGFLYNMVRIMVGTLLDIGSGKLASNQIPEILAGRDRTLAGKTAPPEGLYLWEVYYEED